MTRISIETSPAQPRGSIKMPQGTERDEMAAIKKLSDQNYALQAEEDKRNKKARETELRTKDISETIQLTGDNLQEGTSTKPLTDPSSIHLTERGTAIKLNRRK